jgi:hypothetical protein
VSPASSVNVRSRLHRCPYSSANTADVAALDQAIMGLAAAYAQLPALAQQTSEAAARPGISATVAARGRLLCRQANELLSETATAIRDRLGALADRDRRQSHLRRR